MIKFSCNNCGHKLGVKDEMAGKRGKCPECGGIIVVPEKNLFVSFQCQNCGRNISALPTQTGKKGKCPNCNVTLVVPQLHSLTLLDTPAEYKLQDRQPGPLTPAQKENEYEENEQEFKEEIESGSQRNLPWIIDIFLYPTSAPGLINLAIFIGIPFLLHCIRQLLGPLAPMSFLLIRIMLIPNILIGLYMLWYLTECVRDSAKGGTRAPEAFATTGLGDIWEQAQHVIGCYLILLGPVFFYHLFAGRTDMMFWLLMAYGVIFFPMGLLACVMFDSIRGLNPILLIGSIASTFLKYCGLVLLVCGIVLSFRTLAVTGGRLESGQITTGTTVLGAVFSCLLLYMVFVVAHLLGRFYWRYQDKLNWEV